jgi:hypothetical protein
MVALDSILILRTSANHKVTNLENEEPLEAEECTFSPEIHELTLLCECGRVVIMKLEESNRLQGLQIAVRLPPFLAHLQSLCATEILEHAIENYCQTLSESSLRYQ